MISSPQTRANLGKGKKQIYQHLSINYTRITSGLIDGLIVINSGRRDIVKTLGNGILIQLHWLVVYYNIWLFNNVRLYYLQNYMFIPG